MRLDCDLKEPFIPTMVDFRGIERMIQPCRFKIDQICDIMVSYLRSVCKTSFFDSRKLKIQRNASKKVLLTKPVNLFYEQYVFMYYKQVLKFIQANIEKTSTLEKDLELLDEGPHAPKISFELKMVLVYRSEKKKIIRSQIHLIDHVLDVLKNIEPTLTQNPKDAE